MSRLKLDWNLQTRPERNQFVSSYLKTITYTPNEEELDMMGKYILWGKDPDTGLNGRQEGLELETSSRTWDSSQPESLEALLESPTFNESMVRAPSKPVYKTPRLQFSREEARKKAPPDLLAQFERLWAQIDETDLIVEFWELEHNRRTKPPRESLLARFTDSELDSLRQRSTSLNMFQFLKLKHLLVELRRQQYTLRDYYAPSILGATTPVYYEEETLLWGQDVTVEPLSFIDHPYLWKLLLRRDRFPEPQDFTEDDFKVLSKWLWMPRASTTHIFKFNDPAHLVSWVEHLGDLKAAAESKPNLESNLSWMIEVWETYVALAPLKDFQRIILKGKELKWDNGRIVEAIQESGGRHYTLNYISTLYRQSILPTIAETADLHAEVVKNLMFEEEFKTCLDCGRTLLRSYDNFMKKSKNKDGLSPRCKQCDKKLRERRKEQ